MNFNLVLFLFFYLSPIYLIALATNPKTKSFLKPYIRPLLPVLKFIRRQFVIWLPYFFVITFLSSFIMVQQRSNWWCFWYVISFVAILPPFLSKEESNPVKIILDMYYKED